MSKSPNPIIAEVKAIFASAPTTGMTADEVVYRTGRFHNSIAPIICRMAKLGELVDTGNKAQTRSGKAARLYILPATI